MALDTSTGAAKMEGSNIVVVRDTPVTVFGKGFTPGSEIEVCVFSTPTFLGTALVGADGTFSKEFTIPASVPAGRHTLQAEGVSATDTPKAVSAGVIVRGLELPETGSSFTGIVQWATIVLLAGVALLATRKRRTSN
jgi:LPXTG-motif cell wall-anchored protein